MKIEMTYIFHMNKYCEETENGVLLNIKDGGNVIYAYKDKQGKNCSIDVFVNILDEFTLLGNDVFSEVNEESDLFAKVSFKDKETYNNFVLPCWLDNFKYIE